MPRSKKPIIKKLKPRPTNPGVHPDDRPLPKRKRLNGSYFALDTVQSLIESATAAQSFYGGSHPWNFFLSSLDIAGQLADGQISDEHGILNFDYVSDQSKFKYDDPGSWVYPGEFDKNYRPDPKLRDLPKQILSTIPDVPQTWDEYHGISNVRVNQSTIPNYDGLTDNHSLCLPEDFNNPKKDSHCYYD